jgi:hypothetical protein
VQTHPSTNPAEQQSTERTCPHCGKEFVAKLSIQVYCDPRCRNNAWAHREREKERARRGPTLCRCGKDVKPPHRKHCSDECRRETFAEGHREKLRQKAAAWRASLSPEQRARRQALNRGYQVKKRELNREGVNAEVRQWRIKNPERYKAHVKRANDRKRDKLRDAERLLNVEALDLKTGLRVSLLAHRFVEGASLYDMRNGDVVYPKSQDPFAALRQLRQRFSATIQDEQTRITALPGEQRQSEKLKLIARLKHEEAKPQKKAR